jgi:hypothetical protein
MEPVSTSTSLIVAQVLVPGLQTFTLTYGILNVPPIAAAGPGPTVTATLFDALAPLELLELLAPPELLLPPKLLPEPPPPPQPASTHRPSHTVHRKRWLMHQSRY